MPNNALDGNTSLLLLGGGGCGKSHWLLNVFKPLCLAYFGPRSFLAQCQSNAGARLLNGRTIHSSLGLTPASSLAMESLHLTPGDNKRLEPMAESLGRIAMDERPTVPAKLLHANLLRMSYARLLHAKHEIEDYLNPGQFFGSVPMSVFAGDFLQLPPVPATTSLLNLDRCKL